MKKSILFIISAIILNGCIIPTAALRKYTENFSEVRTTAQQLYLRAGAIAENIADRPETEGTSAEKLKTLMARKAALEARLNALDIIDQYNQVLTSLANGTNPKD